MQIIIRPVPVTFFHVHSLRNFSLSVPINVQTWWGLHGSCEIPVIILPPTRIINSSFRVRFPFACCLLFFVINSIKWETRLSWRGIITLFYSSFRLRTIHMYFHVSLQSDTLKRRGRYQTFFMVYMTLCRVKWSSVEFDKFLAACECMNSQYFLRTNISNEYFKRGSNGYLVDFRNGFRNHTRIKIPTHLSLSKVRHWNQTMECAKEFDRVWESENQRMGKLRGMV